MSKIGNAIHEIHSLDNLGTRDQWVNKIHPLVKFVITLFYIVIVVSFSKYDLIGLGGMVIYPLALFMLADLSFLAALKRLRIVLPLVIFIGIFNPIFDHSTVVMFGIEMWGGILSMITLILKGTFAVLAGYILIATTTMESLCYAFRLIHIPKVLVTQIMLTYRYISVLLEEVDRITQAYSLRAPKQKGVHFKVWGSLTGQLLLRTMDRATNIYESMVLRGYAGDFHYMKSRQKTKATDIVYLLVWVGIIVLFWRMPVFLVVGSLFM